MDDMAILRRAYELENDPRDRRHPSFRNWFYYSVGASRDDMKRLLDDGLIVVAIKNAQGTWYKLSERGHKLVWATTMEREMTKIPAATVMEAMDLVVGFEDIKEAIAMAIESRRRINFMLEGPPACAKSLILEGVRSAVSEAYIVFGARTSAAGLSDALFDHQPTILLMDESDKMENDCYSVLLALMEGGEILETKAKKTRGIKLETMVIAACNTSEKMPREFLSRFALHVHFKPYTRDEFIDVCRGFLTRAENCPPEIAVTIGEQIYDNQIGDVRKARGAWLLMNSATEQEVRRVITLMLKYGIDTPNRRVRSTSTKRLPGM